MNNTISLTIAQVASLDPLAAEEAEDLGLTSFYVRPVEGDEPMSVAYNGLPHVLVGVEGDLDDESDDLPSWEWDPELESWIDSSRF